MILGLDFYGTFTSNPDLYLKLIQSVDKCYIVSAVYPKNVDRLKAETDYYHLDNLIAVPFTDYLKVPSLKYEAVKELGLDLMIGDREDTCRYFLQNGILATRTVTFP